MFLTNLSQKKSFRIKPLPGVCVCLCVRVCVCVSAYYTGRGHTVMMVCKNLRTWMWTVRNALQASLSSPCWRWQIVLKLRFMSKIVQECHVWKYDWKALRVYFLTVFSLFSPLFTCLWIHSQMSPCLLLRCFMIKRPTETVLLTLTWLFLLSLMISHISTVLKQPPYFSNLQSPVLFCFGFFVFFSCLSSVSLLSFLACSHTVNLCHTNDIIVALAAHLWNQGNPRVLDLSLTTNGLCALLTAACWHPPQWRSASRAARRSLSALYNTQ